MKTLAAVLVLAGSALAAGALAAEDAKPVAFLFGTGVKHTNITFVSDTSVETIHGITHTVTGKADLDMDKGEGSAELTIPVKSLDTGIPMRNDHLQSEKWMDAAKHADIVFKTKSLKREKADEKTKKETWSWEADFTLHGVTKALKGEATLQQVPEELGKALGAGRWIKVKSTFDITLADFDVKVPDMAAAKVSPTWAITVDLFGTTEMPKPPEPKPEPKKKDK